jgi:hypothetical protein
MEFFIIHVESTATKQITAKERSVDSVSSAYVLIITLQRKETANTRATRPVSEIAQWKNCNFCLTEQTKA